MYGRKVDLALPAITGNAGEILRQAAALAAAKKINITFRIDDAKLHVTIKDVLPAFDEGWRARLRKDVPLPAEAGNWVDVQRGLKAAKTFGYRRPHPELAPDPGGRISGLAVRRLGRRRRPGLIARPVGTGQPRQASSEKRESLRGSTPKSE
ncbi:hypothetical protein ACVIGB_000476 [Bradyrhizobium sp. USDA 4341]